jgi:hypothetical protein
MSKQVVYDSFNDSDKLTVSINSKFMVNEEGSRILTDSFEYDISNEMKEEQ